MNERIVGLWVSTRPTSLKRPRPCLNCGVQIDSEHICFRLAKQPNPQVPSVGYLCYICRRTLGVKPGLPYRQLKKEGSDA